MRAGELRTFWFSVGSLAAIALLVLVAAAFLSLRTMTVTVAGHAMAPTLDDGARAHYTIGRVPDTLGRGDIVVFRYPLDESKTHLKRIVGLPGEEVTIRDGEVTVDAKPLVEGYVAETNRSPESWGPSRMPEDHYFVLGDNRRNSMDSRHYGKVARKHVIAKISE